MKNKISLLALAIFVSSTTLWGSGFQVVEQGASNLGTALAGAVVNANDDATAAYWNPSAVVFIKSDGKIDSAGTFVIPTMNFTGYAKTPYTGQNVQGANGSDAGKMAFVPNFYASQKLMDELWITFSLTSTYGLETKYDSDFVGRIHGLKSDVFNIDINPSLVFKANDWLSFNAGVSGNYVNADLTSQAYNPMVGYIPVRANGHSWSVSFNLGMSIKFLETGRFGVSYRHTTSHSVDGTVYQTMGGRTAAQAVEAEIDLPSYFIVGVYYRLNTGDSFFDQFAFMFDYAFTQWNSFQNLTFTNASSGAVVSNTPENWRNTSRFSLGMHYHPTWDENLVFRGGITYDQTPVPNAEDRTPRIPDASRWWLSCGLGYKWGRFNFDLAYTYIMFDSARINNSGAASTPLSGQITGVYTGDAHLISAQAGFSW